MTTLLDYVEAAADRNMAFHVQNTDALRESGQSLLLLLLAGGGAALGYAVELIYRQVSDPLFWAIALTSAYLFLLAAWLSMKCLTALPLEAPTNEPMNLYKPKFALDAIREVELQNMQARIEKVRARNDSVSDSMNRVRAAAAGTPVIALGAALIALLASAPAA